MAGVRVAAAVNHWPLAVASHRLNHPETEHRCQDVSLMDPRSLPSFDLLLASPACTGHTHARGKDRPHHDASRSTAWAVVDVAEVTRPRAIAVENVIEILEWKLYPMWRESLRLLGYDLTVNELDAADFGVPQHRVRFFGLAIRGKRCPPMVVKPVAHRSFASILDVGGKWSHIDKPGRAAKSLARIAAGRSRFGDRFLVPYYKSGSGETGRSIDRPIGTLTTHARWAVIDGDRMRMVSIPEARRAMSFRDDYQLLGTVADQNKQLGNAVCPVVAQAVVKHLREVA